MHLKSWLCLRRRDFTNWKVLIQETQTAIDVPLIVKKSVWHDKATLNDLTALGVHTVDGQVEAEQASPRWLYP